MPPTYATELWLPGAPHEVFAHLTEVSRLDALTPPWLVIRLLTPGPVVLARGVCIDYALRLRGLPFRWRTEITAWEPPCAFAERQARGPFVSWEQSHRFEARDGGTVVREVMTYRVPLGAPMDRTLVKPMLEAIQAYRARRLTETFGRDGTRDRSAPRDAHAQGGS